ncbi:hypothetical protein B0H15DRAFT_336945 [Mycena belliarum]|uniref:Uncharacterized protein n=1 Tax=Mycena belliarum TaxID=1033014 RepID=A0AAD6Y1A9_9AGAR|nr:hypothetical protein B0H15DRAFT_336945 [Mycena belliae]
MNPTMPSPPTAEELLVVHTVELVDENADIRGDSKPLKDAAASAEFIGVGVLVHDKTNGTTAHDPNHKLDPENQNESDIENDSSGDEISIRIEGPSELDELSSSALTGTVVSLDASTTDDPDPDPGLDTTPDPSDPAATPRLSRVRFRSRVRITSGLHHHRAHDPAQRRPSGASLSSASRSSSPSSSISAPLRSPPSADNVSPAWGTLGTRVGLFALSGRQAAALAAQARAAKARARARRRGEDADGDADGDAGPGPGVRPGAGCSERTALLGRGGGAPPGFRDARAVLAGGDPEEEDGYFSSDDERDAEAGLARQIDLVFGPWPARLLNRQWWAWQLQPVFACGCLEAEGED